MGTLEYFAIVFEGCTRCTRFSTGFDIGPKKVRGHSRIFCYSALGVYKVYKIFN